MASDLLDLLRKIAEPFDYPRRALWRIPSAIREGDWGALLPAIAGLGATAVGTMAGMPWLGAGVGSLLGGAAYGVGQDIDPVTFRNPTSADLFGEGNELPWGAELALASTVGDPLFWVGLPALRYAGKAAEAAGRAPSALRRVLGGVASVDDAAVRAGIREGTTTNWGGMIDPILERSAMQGAIDASDAMRRLRARQIHQAGGIIEPSLSGEALDIGAGAIGRSTPVDIKMFPQSYFTPVGRRGAYGQAPLDLQLASGQQLGQLPEFTSTASALPFAAEAGSLPLPATLRSQLQPGKIPPIGEASRAVEPTLAVELKPTVPEVIRPGALPPPPTPVRLPEMMRAQLASEKNPELLLKAPLSGTDQTLREMLQKATVKEQSALMPVSAAQKTKFGDMHLELERDIHNLKGAGRDMKEATGEKWMDVIGQLLSEQAITNNAAELLATMVRNNFLR